VLRFGRHTGELFGSEARSTNNRMELEAVIRGLKALKEPCEVTICTDSQYVKRGVMEWLATWKANEWRKTNARGRGGVLNRDLWEELDRSLSPHTIQWTWVKGHGADADNLRCDALANSAAREQISSLGVIRLVS